MNISADFPGKPKRRMLSFFALIMCYSSLHAQIPERNLMYHYPFSGTVVNKISKGEATLTGVPRYGVSRSGQNGGCLQMDGTYSLVLNDSLARVEWSKDLTYSFWINTESISSGGECLISNSYPEGKDKVGYALVINDSGQCSLLCRVSPKKTGLISVKGSRIVNDSKWHHVVLVIQQGKSASVFLDNKPEISFDFPGNLVFRGGFSRIGISSSGSMVFSGMLDDLRLYNTALYPTEFAHLYYEGLNSNYIMIELNDSVSSSNSCTFKMVVSPSRDKVLLNTGKFRAMKGYSVNFITPLKKTVETFAVEKSDYEFDIRKWGGPGVYFMEVYDQEMILQQVYKVNLAAE